MSRTLRWFLADLHIHSCLSPCAELEMTPLRIVKRAAERGLDVIAITDHNSAENAEAAVRIGVRMGVTVLPSMEVTSREEAHVLAIFGSAEEALALQDIVYRSIPLEQRRGRIQQVVVNERDEVMGFNERLLLGAASLTVRELVGEIHALGGLAVASHVDREAFSLMSQLGSIPEDAGIDALEVTGGVDLGGQCPGLPRIRSSDAHRIEDVGRRSTSFFIGAPDFEEIAMAVKGKGGRAIKC